MSIGCERKYKRPYTSLLQRDVPVTGRGGLWGPIAAQEAALSVCWPQLASPHCPKDARSGSPDLGGGMPGLQKHDTNIRQSVEPFMSLVHSIKYIPKVHP